MMEISASQVKQLREMTGAGIMDCKKALKETGGDMDAAVSFLREKGLAAAQKKAGRTTADGLVYAYIHGEGKIGVLVEVNCETDFVAKTDDFRNFVKDVAMHIAAMNPAYISRDDVPAGVVEGERRIFRAQALESGKPEKVVDRIVDGKMEKFYKEVCLLEQPFVKDQDRTIEELTREAVARLGENITIRRFVRYKVGEGIEKKTEDFAAEVAAQM
ncbi:MAG TPA: translation elongation factor Ts [Deltaproteobacteria bacterium]|nr:translation elongation factor Ts [Deltaproteobacteria bacterium]